jgi:DNA invertase Pin-like site-specific DNA recombinase
MPGKAQVRDLEAAGAAADAIFAEQVSSVADRQADAPMLAAVAEFERGLMLERQREDIAKAKAEGAYKGRQPTARAKAARCVLRLANEGVTRQAIASRLGVGVASVYRILAGASTAAA